jgi:ABC-type proline/glycine betaine transport system ATPase subunit
MSNPLSAYDFVYKAMTNDERNDLQGRITNIMVASTHVAAEAMKKAMENALSDLVVVPFHQCVQENASDYEWVSAISNALWKQLLKSNPGDLESYQISALVDAWRTNYPEQFKTVMEGELLKENKRLNELVEFNNRMRENRY